MYEYNYIKVNLALQKQAKLQNNYFQAVESAGIKFPDFKNSGVSLRSQRIKLPSSLGQKKMKGIEQMLNELSIGNNPCRMILCYYNSKAIIQNNECDHID